MHRPIHVPMHPFELQLSATKLSSAAESGTVARDLGFLPERELTPPSRRSIPTSSIFYVWPAPPQRRA